MQSPLIRLRQAKWGMELLCLPKGSREEVLGKEKGPGFKLWAKYLYFEVLNRACRKCTGTTQMPPIGKHGCDTKAPRDGDGACGIGS